MRSLPIRMLPGVLFVFLAGIFPARAADTNAQLAARVVVLANSNEPESVELARYYAKRRDVPATNIIALPMSTTETISWPVFIKTVFQPLQDELVNRHWIDAISTDLLDEIGRRKYAISGHRISYLVVCRGVPLRVEHDAALYRPQPPITDSPQFRTNQGAVDSELSMLALPNYPIAGFVLNPLFAVSHPTEFQESWVVKVSRLDGPSFPNARALVDHALEAEKYGLIGRAYVDIGGPHKMGDTWFELTAGELEKSNFDLSIDRLPSTFPATARFDAPALYFGWYTGEMNGPFIQPGFSFPPGAIALHLHSYSAVSLNSTQHGWTGPLVARGVTATVGNVYEPYLEFTHSPPILARALLRGDNWGDAVYTSVRALSWETMAIGDPLYRPFAINFARQWKDRAKLPDDLFPYVVLREIQRLLAGNQLADARAIAVESMKARPSVTLALAKAHLAEKADDRAEIVRASLWISEQSRFAPSELPLADEAATLLATNNRPEDATDLWTKLLAIPTLTKEFRKEFLQHGIKAAIAAHRDGLAEQWKEEAEPAPKQN